MIVITFINCLTDILAGFSFDFTFNGGVINTVVGIINFIAYILPMGVVFQIITVTFSLMAWRVLVSVIRTLLELIPLA